MSTETGVSGHFSAAHRGQPGDERMHGHTWTVTAWFPNYQGDAANLKRALERVLADLDHTELPDDLSRGEDIATFIAGRLSRCCGVDISRTVEGFHARWRP